MLNTSVKSRKALLRAGLSGLLAVVMILSLCFASGAENEKASVNLDDLRLFEEGSYGYYLENTIADAAPGSETIVIPGASYTPAEGDGHEIVSNYEGKAGDSLLTATDGEATWSFEVTSDGWYNLLFDYYPVQGTGSSIIRKVLLDGELPFAEAGNVSLYRLWDDEIKVGSSLDDAGNEVRSQQVEVPEWTSVYAKDESGKFSDPLKFYLTAGTHTITLDAVKEPVVINKLTFEIAETVPTYEEALAAWKSAGIKETSGQELKIQAENSSRKSHMSIYPVNDRASGITENYDGSGYVYDRTTLNSIGGDKWVTVGQWIEWTVDAPEDGLYNITLRGKQNVVDGNTSYRALTVNGEIPFAEAENLSFVYSTAYKMYTASDDENTPYLFYLKKGENTIRLEAVLGDMEEIVKIGDSCVQTLNDCYLKILMITGTSPDLDRSYNFDQMIPEVIEEMQNQAQIIYALSDMYEQIIGESNSTKTSLDEIAAHLQRMHDRYDRIAEYFSDYKSKLSTLADTINNMAKQPLQLDYMIISSPDVKKVTKGEGNFFSGLFHEIRLFISSFTTDYTNIGATSTSEGAITVWYAGGIEQCKIIKQMATDDFSANYHIPVNIQYIKMDALLPATLAGRAPDVALGQAASDPVNYAMRDAVYDLSQFSDYEEVIKAFPESANMQFEYNGGVYALPETITFPMMFYRTDIVEERGWKLPKTWEDVYALLPDMQKSNMNFGYILAGTTDVSPYVNFLYQHNGNMYKDNGEQSDLDSAEAVDAFIEWTDLYTTYQFDKTLDFTTRFRRGELPISLYTYVNGYNNLTLSAPEIKGLWAMTTVPGRMEEDGTINYTVAATVTGCVLMNQSKNKENAWEFMKWWTSTEPQVRYSQEVESVLGDGARNHTANVEAIKQLSWTNDELAAILDQLEHTKGIPQVPGGYYSYRHIYNGYVKTAVEGEDQRETLLDLVGEINIELTNKRKEYGLSLASDK